MNKHGNKCMFRISKAIIPLAQSASHHSFEKWNWTLMWKTYWSDCYVVLCQNLFYKNIMHILLPNWYEWQSSELPHLMKEINREHGESLDGPGVCVRVRQSGVKAHAGKKKEVACIWNWAGRSMGIWWCVAVVGAEMGIQEK